MKKILCLVILGLLLPSPVFSQVIKLKSGHTIKGKIIKKTKKYIVVDKGLGQPVTYYMNVDNELIQEQAGEPPPTEGAAVVEAVPGPLPVINYDTTNPNISEIELKKTIEVFQLAFNSKNTEWISSFVGDDAKFFCLNKNYKYDYSGTDYINMLKANWNSGDIVTMDISVDHFELEGPQATTDETVTQKSGKSQSDTFRQKNIYLKRDGKVQLISSELLMD